jgi:hypothetical protein
MRAKIRELNIRRRTQVSLATGSLGNAKQTCVLRLHACGQSLGDEEIAAFQAVPQLV